MQHSSVQPAVFDKFYYLFWTVVYRAKWNFSDIFP